MFSIMALALAGSSAAPYTGVDRIADRVTVEDESLESSIYFSTYKVLPEDIVSNGDNLITYLSAAKDRATGDVTYALTLTVIYSDRSWRFYNRLNFNGSKGLVENNDVRTDRKVTKCYSQLDVCIYRESMTISMKEDDVAFLASNENITDPWMFLYAGKSGAQGKYFIMPAEARALLNVIQMTGKNK